MNLVKLPSDCYSSFISFKEIQKEFMTIYFFFFPMSTQPSAEHRYIIRLGSLVPVFLV